MMWVILQQKEPDDYVIASEKFHTVREFVEKSFLFIGIEIELLLFYIIIIYHYYCW